MKKFLLLVILFITIFLTGCKNNYSGDYPELYTVAINSLLWNKGLSTETDRLCDPEIEIIEKDSYGRVLFKYTEKNFTTDLAFSSLLILQSTVDNYVYYYEDYNFICKEKVSHSNVLVEFDSQAVENLKVANDWNEELHLEKCIRKEISFTKEEPPIEQDKLEEIFSEYDGYHDNSTFFLTEDEYGRFICYSCLFTREENAYSEKYVVLLFEKDLTYSILEPTSFYNYQEEFQQFKELNCWNYAIN